MRRRRARDSSRAHIFALAGLLASVGLVAPAPSGSADLTPIVSPDRMEDAPTNSRDALANFAWRAFIALNWPSQTGERGRGEPDREMQFGDHGKRVWETFKSDAELFEVDGDGRRVAPAPWTSTPGGTRAVPASTIVKGRSPRLRPSPTSTSRASLSASRAIRSSHRTAPTPDTKSISTRPSSRRSPPAAGAAGSTSPMQAIRRAFRSVRSRSRRRGVR